MGRVEVSVVTDNPDDLGEVRVAGANPLVEWVNFSLETGYDLDGHTLGAWVTPATLEAFILSNLAYLSPYATHPHQIPKPDRALLPGVIN